MSGSLFTARHLGRFFVWTPIVFASISVAIGLFTGLAWWAWACDGFAYALAPVNWVLWRDV